MASPFDKAAGSKPGVEGWRIEKMHPVRCEAKGQLFKGDAYIFLHTIEKKGGYDFDLFFWLGGECSQDEQGSAAYHTVTLDDQLGGKPVQHREVQGHESSKFMKLFPAGVSYLDGGIESGFKHVDPDKYEPRLLHVKGKRECRVQQVELKSSSLNEGDSFILDLGKTLIQWNGTGANKYEKFKALEMITKINNEERGAKAKLVFLDSGKNDEKEGQLFWDKLGSKKSVKSAEAGGDDGEQKSVTKLFKISDAETTEVGSGALSRSLLDTNSPFLLDTGSHVFVWIGKSTNPGERKEAMAVATKYLTDNNRPNWTPVSRVPEFGEPPAFSSCFSDWNPPRVRKLDEPAARVEEKVDVNSLHVKARRAAEQKMADDGSGKVEIWRIENMAKVSYPKNLYGQFYAGDSYIILYTYVVRDKPKYIIYFWQGRDSSNDEKAASALFAVQMDDELGGDPVQVRVVQNQEPNHFLSLFKGKFVVHEGGIASGFKNRKDQDSYDTDGVSLFHVKGTNNLNTRAVQVAEVASSLNSGDCFVLLTPDTVYVWSGNGANGEEKTCATSIANVLKFGRAVKQVPEGSEPDGFWDALGGKGEYPATKELGRAEAEPRLFHCTTAKKGSFTVSEVEGFTQEDLINDDVMMLDAFSEVFVWVGHNSTKEEKDKSMQVALDYVASATDGRSKDTPVYKVIAGSEPPNFTCHFLGWNEEKALDFTDPYAKKLGLVKAAEAKKPHTPMEVVGSGSIGFAKPGAKAYSHEELKKGAPDNIDPKNKEMYLSDADFQKIFGTDKKSFDALPKWKKEQEKKKHGLF